MLLPTTLALQLQLPPGRLSVQVGVKLPSLLLLLISALLVLLPLPSPLQLSESPPGVDLAAASSGGGSGSGSCCGSCCGSSASRHSRGSCRRGRT